MNDARPGSRLLLRAASIFLALFSLLNILASLLLAFGGFALGLRGGELLIFSLTCLGVLTAPISLAGLAAGVLGVVWCARPDKARTLLAAGAALTAASVLNPLLGHYNALVTGIGLLRLAAAALYALAVWHGSRRAQ